MLSRMLSCLVLLAASGTPAQAADPPPPREVQVAGAVTPAPPEDQADATVLGYAPDGRLVTLREGRGELICLADDPTDDRFHVACYHRSLEPFMRRSRDLRAQGMERSELEDTREREIREGELEMPAQPTALYSYTGPAGSFDPESGQVRGARRVFVLYIPYATRQSTGLSPRQMTPGAPWIMAEGRPWAHVMIVQGPENGEEPPDR
jgi:hypothetical protein